MIDNLIIEKVKSYRSQLEGYSYIDLSKLPNFVVQCSRNKVFFGQVFNSLKHGRGVQFLQDHIYEGEFNNNRKHGQGLELFPSKSKYEGNYVNGKPEGQGKFTWANGECYDGEWFNGNKQGQGTWTGLKGDMYSGEWLNGKPDGQGMHQWINGDQYQGQFKESLKHGHGVEVFANGDSYTGMYQNGKPEGEGEYSWSTGAHFHGQFQNGLRSGYGEYQCATYQYKGFYLNDKKHGYGEIAYTDGTKYKGTFQNDHFEKTVQRQRSVPNNTQPNNTPPKKNNILKLGLKPPKYLSQTKPNQQPPNSPLNKTVVIQRNQYPIQDKGEQSHRLPQMKPQKIQRGNSEKPMEKPIACKDEKVISNKNSPKSQNQQQTLYKQQFKVGAPEFTLRFDTTKTSFKTKTGLKGKQCFKNRSYSKVD